MVTDLWLNMPLLLHCSRAIGNVQLGRQEGVFDNILEVASNVWIWTWEGGSAWYLSGPLKRLAYSRIDLSLLQRQSTSQEMHGLGTLRPGDRRLVLVSNQSGGELFCLSRRAYLDYSLI